MVEVLLRAEHLHKRFGGVLAANDVSFTLARGELRCVIGPNGAGKSTFFSLLCGIQSPDRGKIRLGDRDITASKPFARVRLGLGLTFQTNRAFHALTVAENLETARRRVATNDDERFQFAFDAFELAPSMGSRASELAHHHLQWLEICMALRAGPSVLLLDEPTAGLSPMETRRTGDVLRALAATGLAVAVVEHDIAFVRHVADSVTVLHQGRVFAEGSVDEVTARDDVRSIYLGHRPARGVHG